MTDPQRSPLIQAASPRLMHHSQRKEQLSFAYTHAVTAFAGYDLVVKNVDDDGWDLGITSRGTHGTARGPSIFVQLKSTTLDIVRGNKLVYPLKVHNYNDLIGSSVTPRLLVLFHMPDVMEDWITTSEDQLIIRRCAYWKSLKNEPETSNRETINVDIPRSNIFTPQALHDIFDRIGRGEEI